MAVSSISQLQIFLFSLLGGILVGVFFDVFRATRQYFHSGVFSVGVQDLLFWLFTALSVFLFLYRVNYGQPRWYIFLGIFVGGFVYHLIVGRYVVTVFLFLFRMIAKLFSLLLAVLKLPIKFLGYIFRPFGRFFARIFRFSRRRILAFWVRNTSIVKKIKKRMKMY